MRRVRAALLHRLLRHPLPRRQARHGRDPRLRRRAPWRTSAASPTARRRCSVDPATASPARDPAGRRRRRPRDRPHVVRRPRDHGLVGGHLAQRGVRHLHGGAVLRRLPPRVAALGQLRHRPRRGAATSTRLHSTRPIEYEVVSPDDAERHVRRPHLREGRRGPAHARAVPRATRSSATASATTCATTLRQHRDRPTCGTRSRRSRGQPVRDDDGHLDPPGRPPARDPRGRRDHPGPFAYGPATGESAIGSSWLVPVLTRARSGGRRRRASCSARSPLAIERGPPASSTPAAPASTAPLRRRRARGHRRRPRTRSTSSSAQRSSPTPGPLVLAGQRELGRPARRWRAGSATEVEPAPGRGVAGRARLHLPRPPTRRGSPGGSPTRALARSARSSSASAGTPSAGEERADARRCAGHSC